MGGKGTSVNYPGPSPEERALQAKQLALMEAAEAREKAWSPILLSEMGYKTDAAGNIIELTQEEKLAAMSEAERMAYDIAKLSSEREMKALRGELEIDPATERSLSEEEARLRQSMYKQLGEGWETSTAGIQAMGEQRQRAAAIRDAVRRGEMTTTESLAQSRQSQLDRSLQQFLSASAEPTQRQLGVASAYSTPLSWYGQQRANIFAENQAEAQMRAERMRQITSASSSAMSGPNCCFIFLEGGMLTAPVRRLRDKMFGDGFCRNHKGYVPTGYRAMAKWLVPMMRRNWFVRNFVIETMLRPIATFCRRYEQNPKDGVAILLTPICKFWTGIWALYGRTLKIA